jgi:hypothetical protein
VKTSRGRGRRSRPPDHAAHYARARAAATPKKARPRCKNRSLYCGAFNGPVPCETRRTLEQHGLLARDNVNPRAGASVRRSPRGPPETRWASQAPMPRSTLERHEPLALDNGNPLMGPSVRRSPRGPLETKWASQAPMPRSTLERREPLARDNINLLKGHKRERVALRPA